MTGNKVQKTVSYETVVDDLPSAWAFIMSKIETVGPDPSVHIHPASTAPPPMLMAIFGRDDIEVERKFHIVVEGTTSEVREEANAL